MLPTGSILMLKSKENCSAVPQQTKHLVMTCSMHAEGAGSKAPWGLLPCSATSYVMGN